MRGGEPEKERDRERTKEEEKKEKNEMGERERERARSAVTRRAVTAEDNDSERKLWMSSARSMSEHCGRR